MINPSEIIDQLYTIFHTNVDNVNVYKRIPNEVEAYPAIMILSNRFDVSHLDLRDDNVEYEIKLVIVSDLGANMQEAQKTVDDLLVEVLEIVHKQGNIKLGNTVSSVRATSGQFILDVKETNTASWEVDLQVRKPHNRYA